MSDDDPILRSLRNIERLLGQQEQTRRRALHEEPLQATKDQTVHVALGSVSSGGGGGPSADIDVASFFRDGIGLGGPTETFVMIDRDNGGGSYKHSNTDGWPALSAVAGHLFKAKDNAQWEAYLAIITDIGPTDADLAVVEFGALHSFRTDSFEIDREHTIYPIEMDFTIVGGELRNIVPARVILNDTTVNTATPLQDVTGQSVTPEVGDLLIRVDRVNGTDVARVSMDVWYRMVGS